MLWAGSTRTRACGRRARCENLEVTLRTNPQHPRYQYHPLGVAYARRGEIAKARAALVQALAVPERFAERGKAEAALAALPK